MGLNGTYDPKKVLVSFSGIPITGFAEGSMITVKRNEDTFKEVVGSSGEESWTKNANRSGEITLELMATSQNNDQLNQIYQQDELLTTGLAPFFLKELNGTTICQAPFARLVKPADVERGKEQGKATWIIKTTNLDTQPGGIYT